MEQNITITPEVKGMVSVQGMNPIPRELKYIMSQVEAAVRSGKTRYLISSRHLKPEYERVLVDAGYKIIKGRVATQITW
ncbi:hypothetical protein [Bacteroides rodentium]